MPNPPLHYRTYWQLEDNSPELFKDAKYLLSGYIQSWGQSNYDKTNCLTIVAKRMGFKVETALDPNSDLCGWSLSNPSQSKKFYDFVESVRMIVRGNFESETVQLANLIVMYRQTNWLQRLF